MSFQTELQTANSVLEKCGMRLIGDDKTINAICFLIAGDSGFTLPLSNKLQDVPNDIVVPLAQSKRLELRLTGIRDFNPQSIKLMLQGAILCKEIEISTDQIKPYRNGIKYSFPIDQQLKVFAGYGEIAVKSTGAVALFTDNDEYVMQILVEGSQADPGTVSLNFDFTYSSRISSGSPVSALTSGILSSWTTKLALCPSKNTTITGRQLSCRFAKVERELVLLECRMNKTLVTGVLRFGGSGENDQFDLTGDKLSSLFTLPELGGTLFQELNIHLPVPEIDLREVIPHWTHKGLDFNGIKLTFGSDSDSFCLKFIRGSLSFNEHLGIRMNMALGYPTISFDLDFCKPILVGADKPFTIVLHEGERYLLSFRNGDTSLEVQSPENKAVASVFIPGISSETAESLKRKPDFMNSEIESRFQMQIKQLPVTSTGERAPALRFGPGGAFFRAEVVERQVALPILEETATTKGYFDIRGESWSLNAQARSKLPYIKDAYGEIQVNAGSGEQKLSIRTAFEMKLGEVWTDPTETLAFHDPIVYVSLTWSDGHWVVDGDLSGSLEFLKAPLVPAAGAWVKEIFDNVTIEFTKLNIKDLYESAHGTKDYPIKVNFTKGFNCTMWDIFTFTLTGFHIGSLRRIKFEGMLDFNFGMIQFGGSLPGLAFELPENKNDSVKFALESSKGFSIHGGLDIPSGIKATMQLTSRTEKVQTETGSEDVDIIDGSASLRIPKFPEIEVMVSIGRLEIGGKKKPTLAIFGQAGVAITVFPGVVLRKVGAGIGIHRSLKGLHGLSVNNVGEAFKTLLDIKKNPPDPSQATSWEVDKDTSFNLVTRVQVSATTSPTNVPDYYVANAVAVLDSNYRLAAFGQTWVLTSLEAMNKNPEFRNHPYSTDFVLLNASVPSIFAISYANSDTRTSLGEPVNKALNLFAGSETVTRFGASPHEVSFDTQKSLRIRLGPINLNSSALMGIKANRRGICAYYRSRFHASLSFREELTIGPATIWFGASAGLETALDLFGELSKGRILLYGKTSFSVWFKLEVGIRITFQISIKIVFARITITVTINLHAEIGLNVGVFLEAEAGSNGIRALASGNLSFSVCGFGIELPRIQLLKLNDGPSKEALDSYNRALTGPAR